MWTGSLIQLEMALHRLVESFWEEPYRYFTEADALTAVQFWIDRRPEGTWWIAGS